MQHQYRPRTHKKKIIQKTEKKPEEIIHVKISKFWSALFLVFFVLGFCIFIIYGILFFKAP